MGAAKQHFGHDPEKEGEKAAKDISEGKFRIYGKVILRETRKGLPNVIVEALDKDFILDDRLGSVITDKDGNFEILYDREDFWELFFDRKPDIYLRIRRPDGKIIHTTKDKVIYGAGRTEAFHINIPKSLIEEEAMKESNYKIEGKIDTEVLEKIPKDLDVRIYAVRERRVLGSSPIEKDGSFSIKYKYDIYEKGEKRLAIGSFLIVGPHLPGDEILKEKFPTIFLSPEEFKEKDNEWYVTVSSNLIKEIIDNISIIEAWWRNKCYEWRPCVQVLACSKIESGLCYGEQPLTKVHLRIYEVGWPIIYPIGTSPKKYTVLVAEGDTDQFGYFKSKKTICKKLLMIPFYKKLGYLVEVGQIIDGAFNSIYKDPEDQLRELNNDLCEEIYIDKTKVVIPEPPEGLLTGNIFKLTRIGNIPVGYINQNPTSPFHGYANSLSATDSATLKVTDSAFYDTIKLFANIGDGIVNTVKYYRIKYSYKKNDSTTIENYLAVPFYNLRESTDVEETSYGPYKTEFMGPTDGFYAYPNPYDNAVNKQWVYKGLIMVLNTATLPLPYGKFTFTIEVFDASKNPVTVDNPADLTCTILVDNTTPTGSIGDILGPSGSVPACGLLKLPFLCNRTQTCYGSTYTRKVVHGKISVPFSAQDKHGLIHSIVLSANFGCNESVALVSSGKKPTIGCDGTTEYQVYNDVPFHQRPKWIGRSDYCASSDQDWDECAYQFLLTIYKRVTNGEVAYPWWNFTKHITITQE